MALDGDRRETPGAASLAPSSNSTPTPTHMVANSPSSRFLLRPLRPPPLYIRRASPKTHRRPATNDEGCPRKWPCNRRPWRNRSPLRWCQHARLDRLPLPLPLHRRTCTRRRGAHRGTMGRPVCPLPASAKASSANPCVITTVLPPSEGALAMRDVDGSSHCISEAIILRTLYMVFLAAS
jgi:hypothetical protein